MYFIFPSLHSSSSSLYSSLIFSNTSFISSQSKPTSAALCWIFSAFISAGKWLGILFKPSVMLVSPFSSRFNSSHVFSNLSIFKSTSLKTWGCLCISFVHIPFTTSFRSKYPSSLPIWQWNTTCKSISPSSSIISSISSLSIAWQSSYASSIMYFFKDSCVCFLSQSHPPSPLKVSIITSRSFTVLYIFLELFGIYKLVK